MAKKKTIDDLNQLYSQAETADKELFSEIRSNVLLVAGNHYSNKGSKIWNRIRDTKELATDAKVRLTKNHIGKIAKQYVNNIVSCSPGVAIIPRNPREMQDQKAAQLNNSVWQYGKDVLKFDMKVISLAKDYVDAGEALVKVFWNPNAGKFLGHEQKIDGLTGEPMVGPDGALTPDEAKPKFEGKLEIEQIFPSNLFRDPQCTNMEEALWWGIRKMMDVDKLKEIVGDDPEKLKAVQPSEKEQYMVFEANQGYTMSSKQALVREFYFKPCGEYPTGYYFITTQHGILFEGELPFGVWPLVYVGFDAIQTSPRHRSIIKQLRPYQMEINRTASKIAEHQVTSDDKVLIQSGTKISSGGVLPGVRAIQYQGVAPTVLQGRTGEQYLPYMDGQIREMYQVANLTDEVEERKQAESNPYGMLFRSVKDQRKFTIYVEKFEGFLKQICITYLSLGKQYFDEGMLIPMIGKAEYVNIPEFKSTQELQYQIEVKPMSDDINSMFGKMLAINHALQYVGPQMDKEQLGMMIRQMPYANAEEGFSDFTLNYDIATNFILALERGERPEPSASAPKEYMLRRLDKRMMEADFNILPEPIKATFEQAKQTFQQLIVQDQQQIQRAEQGFIPAGGPLIKTDLQVSEPNTTGGMKTTRQAFPVESLMWLQKQLEIQGQSQEFLQSQLPPAEVAQIASKFNQSQPAQPQQSGLDQLIQSHKGPAPVQGA
jgi:hypothetical protein